MKPITNFLQSVIQTDFPITVIFALVILISHNPVVAQPVRIIFDTDMAQDVDDVGALAILNHLADLKECELLAVGISTPVNTYDGYYAATCASAINHYYGRPDIPIGGFRGSYPIIDAVSKYVEPVSKAYKHKLNNGLETEEAWRLYRKVLAAQPDTSVVIVVVGFLNNLECLLDSKPDEYSPRNGFDLVLQKVKFVSCMGGNFAHEAEEYNFNTYPRSTLFFLSNWPTSIVFGGGELGSRVKCGRILQDRFSIHENPVAMAWHLYNGGEQRESWDELSALYAVRGCSAYFRLSDPGLTIFRMHGGNQIHGVSKSKNIWIPDSKGKHRYLIPAITYSELGMELDKLLVEKPVK